MGHKALVLIACALLVGLAAIFGWESPHLAQDRELPPGLPVKYLTPDKITAAVKDPSAKIFVVDVSDKADRSLAAGLGTIIADHGSFALISTGADSLPPSLAARRLETTIDLPGGQFDPLVDSQPLWAPDKDEGNYYIVQLGTLATDDLLDSLRACGVEILQYVPHQAFFVYGSRDSIALAANHNRVRWVGNFRPEFKLSRVLKEQLKAHSRRRSPRDRISRLELTAKDTAIFDVAVFAREDLKSAAERIALQTGGQVRDAIRLPNNFFNVVRIEAGVDRIVDASVLPEVFSIESWSRPKKEDEIAAHIVAGNYTGNSVAPPGYDPLGQFGVNGTGVTVSVVDDGVGIPGDGGFYVTAGNTVNGPLRGATAGAQGHGHLQASIIAGDAPFSVVDANGYNYGLGIAPKSNIVNIPFLRTGYTGNEADTANDTVAAIGPNGARGYISNNSWGNGTNGNSYDSYAAQFDGFVRDASAGAPIDPLVLVFSAGNSGTSGLTRPKVAKNVIAVAATENVRPTLPSSGGSTGVADNIEQLPDFSSRGPAADFRIKPDIAAPGDAITGGRSGTNSLFGNIDPFHRVSSGTSHAAPQVAGAAALFTEYWRNLNGSNYPSPAMVKAAIINGAVDVTGLGAAAARPNDSEGWGRINLKNVMNTGSTISYFDQDLPLSDVGSRRNFSGTVTDPAKPVRISLVWTDPPGAGNPALVNDLDLEVLIGGERFKGNVFASGTSAAGGLADDRNNVENVFLPAGLSGPVTVRVTAKAINGDGILGNPDLTDQHFALVSFNAAIAPSSSAFPDPGPVAVLTGNNVIEPSECNLIEIPLSNLGQTEAAGVTATLITTTPGVSVTVTDAAYPDIQPGATQSGLTPFQISTGNTIACLTNIDLVLYVNFSGGGSSMIFNYTIPVGTPPGADYGFVSTGGASISPTGTLVAGTSVDDDVIDLSVPFAFSVYDTSVAAGSTIRLGTNGQIRIEPSGSAGAAVTNTALPTSGGGSFPAAAPTLFPYWDDLDMRPSVTNGGGIYTEVSGSPGSRTLKIEWRARNYFATQPQGDPNVNFAVYFHENSDQFEYVYALTGGGIYASGASATVGVQSAASGTRNTQFSFNTASLSSGLRLAASRPAGICSSGAGPCLLTASPVEVSGRVVSRDGRGIPYVRISLTSPGGRILSALTNTFGYFRLSGVGAGETYVLSASSRTMRFQSTVLNVNGAISDVVLIPEP